MEKLIYLIHSICTECSVVFQRLDSRLVCWNLPVIAAELKSLLYRDPDLHVPIIKLAFAHKDREWLYLVQQMDELWSLVHLHYTNPVFSLQLDHILLHHFPRLVYIMSISLLVVRARAEEQFIKVEKIHNIDANCLFTTDISVALDLLVRQLPVYRNTLLRSVFQPYKAHAIVLDILKDGAV